MGLIDHVCEVVARGIAAFAHRKRRRHLTRADVHGERWSRVMTQKPSLTNVRRVTMSFATTVVGMDLFASTFNY